MKMINHYQRHAVFRVIAQYPERWMVSLGRGSDGVDESLTISLSPRVRKQLRDVQEIDWVRGTVTCAQYLTDQESLVARSRLSSVEDVTVRSGTAH